MKTTTEPTKVIFRIWPESKGGDVIAIFPQEPANSNPDECMSYQHAGQHGACSTALCSELRLATSAEREPLKKELERLGYVLDIGLRITPKDRGIRLETYRASRK